MSEEKKLLRKQIKSILREMSERERNLQSQAICEAVLESKYYTECDVLFSYMALWDEVDLSFVNERAFVEKKLVLPRVISVENGVMEFFCVNGDRPLDGRIELNRGDRPLSQFLESGSYNIKEPDVNLVKKVLPSDLCGKNVLCLVPGVSFTKDGCRLGRGKGFYDKALDSLLKESRMFNFSLRMMGVCFDSQIVNNLPVEENDVKLDGIVSVC